MPDAVPRRAREGASHGCTGAPCGQARRACRGLPCWRVLASLQSASLAPWRRASPTASRSGASSDRDGPFAAAAAPVADGLRDYLAMINARDGGVNGIALVHDGMRRRLCRARAAPLATTRPRRRPSRSCRWSAAIALDVLPSASRDSIAMLTPGIGAPPWSPTDAIFPWAFAMPATRPRRRAGYPVEAISEPGRCIAGQDDCPAAPRRPGKRRRGGVCSRCSRSVSASRCSTCRSQLKEVRTQSAQWQEIGRAKPDYVVIAGLGAMIETALAEAHNANFPMSRLIGMSWSATDAELALLGDAAKGYQSGVVEPAGRRSAGPARHRRGHSAGADKIGPRRGRTSPGCTISAASWSARSWSRRSGWRIRISTGATSTGRNCAGRSST